MLFIMLEFIITTNMRIIKYSYLENTPNTNDKIKKLFVYLNEILKMM